MSIIQLRRATISIVATVGIGLTVLGTASAAGASPENGCNGLYEVARFATFSQVGDTNGHATVHHQFEVHGCAHHDHP